MNDKFDNQKETLVSLSHEISLLQQQVKYLIRNEKAAELLDLDVLMNRTHTIYDMICTISVNDNDEEQDFDINPEALTALFGGMAEEEETIDDEAKGDEEEDEGVVEPSIQQVSENQVSEELESVKENADENLEENDDEIHEIDEPENEPIIEDIPEVKEEPIAEDIPKVEEEPISEEQPETKQEGDDFGLFFRFEDIPMKDEAVESEEIKEDVVEEVDGKTIHFMEEVPIDEIPERDRVEGEDLVTDDPFKMPAMEDSSSPYGGYFEKDDMGFEINTNETLGESMMEVDNSLAAKFQQAPVNDLKSSIGLNDKFLFVNELFGGSMEKYNKSIDNLNDLKTLNGAMIYLNELKVELQWNSSNEAYKKLWEKVAQKFNA